MPQAIYLLKMKNILLRVIHHDNASSHLARITFECLERQKKIIEHPPYSPDLSMCGFWLFFNLKKDLRGRHFHSEDEIDEDIKEYFSSSTNRWLDAFNLWKMDIQKCINLRENYFEHS